MKLSLFLKQTIQLLHIIGVYKPYEDTFYRTIYFLDACTSFTEMALQDWTVHKILEWNAKDKMCKQCQKRRKDGEDEEGIVKEGVLGRLNIEQTSVNQSKNECS